MVEQTGRYNLSIKGEKKKENSSLSKQMHNCPFTPVSKSNIKSVYQIFKYAYEVLSEFEDNGADNLLHPVVKGFKGKKSKIENMNGFGRVIVMILFCK